MISVIENAYHRKVKEIPNYGELHKNVLFVLLHEKKYYSKEELVCITNYNYKMLDLILEDLEKAGTILIEGWLVKLKEIQEFEKEICEELKLI